MLQTTRRTVVNRLATTLAMTLTTALVMGVGIGATMGVTACGKGENAAANATPVAGKITATGGTAAPASADSDRAANGVANGAGLPTGYSAVFDQADAKSSDVSYAEKEPGRWEVRTGPAHILFSSKDTAANKYSVSATFEQLQAPAHPEAYGVFIGGSNLRASNVRYTYFLVRGDGMYTVKVRDGAGTRTITDWTAQPSIPRQDAAGKGLYGIRIDVSGKMANVSVNGVPITTISGKDAPLNGISGVRINHNLHLVVTPVSLIR